MPTSHNLPSGQPGDAAWRKSTYSAAHNECVEIADLPNAIAVRDSKSVSHQPLVLPRSSFTDFITGCRTGHWDTPD
ncbi:DUF397 domain-containing protein [Streptomyces chrestomyceticus]|uniref:DUF397 domain-containing protein n=1 Tax=Streptomyces chrestomyceticus TaxID=68185 RepID=UPI0037ACA340